MTNSTPFRPYCAVQVLLLREDEGLLSRRAGTGFEDGKYGLVGGHIEGSKSARQAAARELAEETGVTVDPSALEHIYTLHRFSPDREYVDLFFSTSHWSGAPEIRERHRCSELSWFPLDELPHDTIGYVRAAIADWRAGRSFGEWGWPS